MKFDDFERRARAEWDRIPVSYKEGVDGLIVEREARSHPSTPDVYTLGECATESYPSDYGGPDTIRSSVVLYYGSFRRLSLQDSSFDWEEELWETLMHELQHHLESLAADESLLDLDYAVEQGFRRDDGEAFDPYYYRAGESLGDGWYRIEKELFVERPAGEMARFEVAGVAYEVAAPSAGADVALVAVTGLPESAGPVTLAFVRPRGWRGLLRSLLGSASASVVELEAAAREAAGASDREHG
jgi:Zincin-like metallopeptidase